MPRRKKDDPGSIKENIIAYANDRGFTEEFVTDSLKNAIIKSYAKQYLGVSNIEDGIFNVELLDNNKTYVTWGRIVKDPDEITDDFLEIDSDDDDVVEQGLKVGDIFYLKDTFDELEKMDPLKFAKFSRSYKTAFINNITQAEKAALYEKYQSKIGELVDAKVEKYNDEKGSYTVSIGKTMARLGRNDLIGREKFAIGEIVKVYLHSIELTNKASSQQGAVLRISRSSREFLKKVFEMNINEIYDGTIIIKNIARQAGVRSKVAVYTNDPNVDPKGACIGSSGSRIQGIVQNHLGNAPEKEKIDVVNYNKNLYVYLVEAFFPAIVTGVGIYVDENGKKKANVIVRSGETNSVIGKGGVNVRLAAQLCGVDIQIFTQEEAWEKGIDFIGSAEIKQMAENGEGDGFDKEVSVKAKEPEVIEEVSEIEPEVEEIEEVIEEPEIEEAKEPEVKEVKVQETKPEQNAPEAPVEHVNVNVTASILDIEAKLDEEKEKLAAKSAKKAYKKPKKEEKKVVEEDSSIIAKGMDIYSEEELADLDAQDLEDFEEEDSSEYDSYDDDSYYDDEN